MTILQALVYFFREATASLVRSWKISSLAILTICVSLFVLGAFVLLSGNLGRVIDGSRDQGRVVVYLEPGIPDQRLIELVAQVASEPLVRSLETIDTDQARLRFEAAFPSLADLLDSASSADAVGGEVLPGSLEIEVVPEALGTQEYRAWIDGLRHLPDVSMVDDDRQWLRQLDTAVTLVRGFGFALALLLMMAAVFTIGSVIRLTVYLYQEEFAVMRLVGATEFFIRGPFYVEGFLQGLLGGCIAALGLWSAHAWIATKTRESLLGATLFGDFLSPRGVVSLIALGALAGLIGAIISLRRERFSASPDA